MSVHDLKHFLQQPFPGKAAFFAHILLPLFGEENVIDTYDEPLLDHHPALRPMAEATGIRAITRIAHIDLGLQPLDIFDITVADRVRMAQNRVGVQQLVRRIMDTYSGAFLLIHYEGRPDWEWRFTFCHKAHDATTGTDARRFTFLLGPGQACRTAAENFRSLIDRRAADPEVQLDIDDLRRAFSVEALSREFFARYKAHYARFVDFMVSDAPMRQDFTGTSRPASTPEARNREEKPIRDYVKKLLGRIVFLHFVQKKRWLGVPLGAPWGEGPDNFLLHLFSAAPPALQADFLDGVLEPLFDRGLDTDRSAEGDAYDTLVPAVGTVRIPWLSGGLFERDRLDRLPSRFPPELFRDLFEMLAEYNFTVDENDPDDAEVGVDPEMLGRIFENLLENNNDTGAFYTPKEVVRYMCRESLLAHLVATLPGVDAHTLRALVESHNVEQLPAPLAEKIDRTLADVKICDPAIGSGAFPMGLLRLLFACRTALTPLLEARRTAADLKRHIIRHNIYGVDIERGAVDIARLRFWLALVVDAPTPLPLPHLDYKIMQGDSLLERIADVDLSHIAEAGAVAPPVQQDLFGAVDLDAARVGFATAEACATFRRNLERAFDTGDHEERLRLRTSLHRRVASAVLWSLAPRLEQARRTLADLDAASAPLTPRQRKEQARLQAFVEQVEAPVAYINAHKALPPTECFLWHTWFRDVFERPSKEGFDIVIGNPPYGAKIDSSKKDILKSLYMSAQTIKGKQKGSLDSYVLFLELGFNLLNKNGEAIFIVPLSITASDAVSALHHVLTNGCERISVSSFGDRPKCIFENVEQQVSIIEFSRTGTPTKELLTTGINKRFANEPLQDMLNNLHFVNALDGLKFGRIPKIGTQTELDILHKVDACPTFLEDVCCEDGLPVFYRKAGGRYYKIITKETTGSSAEGNITIQPKYRDLVGAVLSSNLFYWYWLIYSDWHNLRKQELLSFPLPISECTTALLEESQQLYEAYLQSLYENSEYTKSGLRCFYARRSKEQIDALDRCIGKLYGLTTEEISFLINFDARLRSGE